MKYIIVFTKSKISIIDEVLDNYYINDKIKIEPLLNKLSDNFQMILFNKLKMGNLSLKVLYIY